MAQNLYKPNTCHKGQTSFSSSGLSKQTSSGPQLAPQERSFKDGILNIPSTSTSYRRIFGKSSQTKMNPYSKIAKGVPLLSASIREAARDGKSQDK